MKKKTIQLNLPKLWVWIMADLRQTADLRQILTYSFKSKAS